MKERIYVCHTYYHVYIAILKEFALGKSALGQATMLLSTLSNDFESLGERLEASCVFERVVVFHEQPSGAFQELDFFKVNQGNLVKNMIARIHFTKLFAKLQEPYISVDFKQYKDIYVFCDSDPIGYYLNQNKIPYHAIEDGLNCLKPLDTARFDNRGCFWLKVLFSRMNLIFIQNGYGSYCIDMEVNDISAIHYPCKKYVEVPRSELVSRLTREEEQCLLTIFIKDLERLESVLETAEKSRKKTVVILTEPLGDLVTRKQIFRDLIEGYGKEAIIILKQHPRDELAYQELFPECLLIDKSIPMEMLNYLHSTMFDQVISVFTQVDGITFAKDKVFLGPDFMDQYEAPHLHRQNEQI